MSDASSDHNANCFDFIRLVAAWLVLYSHSYALVGLPEPTPIAGQSFGSLAVAVFFSLSGYLVCQSWSRDPSAVRFAIRRGLRIFPGLLVVILFTAFGVGVAFTKLQALDYLRHPETWSYVPKTVLMLSVPHLPGVFESNPFPKSTNGSLWTLRYEVLMYATLAVLGSIVPQGRLSRASMALLVVCTLTWLGLAIFGYSQVQVPGIWRMGTELYVDRLAYLGAFFFGGSCMYLYRDRIKLSIPVAFVLVVGATLMPNPTSAMATLWIAVPYGVISVAFLASRRFRFVRGHDYSYGIYIYAFPVQQAISALLAPASEHWLAALAASTAITFLVASLSWHYIESPALATKDRAIRRFTKAGLPSPIQGR